MKNLEQIKETLLALDKEKKIRFISLFGSQATGKTHKDSDVDLAVFYDGSKKERFAYCVKASGEFGEQIDLHIFQDLPLAVKKEVLGGKVLYYQNFQFVFDVFMKIIREFDYFERHLETYYAAVEGGTVGA